LLSYLAISNVLLLISRYLQQAIMGKKRGRNTRDVANATTFMFKVQGHNLHAQV
jgi:hypothetical protein